MGLLIFYFSEPIFLPEVSDGALLGTDVVRAKWEHTCNDSNTLLMVVSSLSCLLGRSHVTQAIDVLTQTPDRDHL